MLLFYELHFLLNLLVLTLQLLLPLDLFYRIGRGLAPVASQLPRHFRLRLAQRSDLRKLVGVVLKTLVVQGFLSICQDRD